MPASRGPDGSKTCCFLLSGIHRVLFSVSFLCMLSPCLSSCFHLDRHGSLRHIEAQRHCRIRIRTQGFWLPAQRSCPWTRLPGGREGRTLLHPTLPCRRGPSSEISDSMSICYDALGTAGPAFPWTPTVRLQCQRFQCTQPSSALPTPHGHTDSGGFYRRKSVL